MKAPARFACLTLTACCSMTAHAQDPEACRTVHFADIGWTDIAATTALASTVFDGLGYKPVKTVASIPIALTGIKSKQIDVFLGDWQPSMDPVAEPFVKAGTVKDLTTPNLTGAKNTLAVTTHENHAGLKALPDIAKFPAKLQDKNNGIEP